MSDKHGKTEYTEQETYQTGSTCPPRNHSGIIAFLLGLVIILCGISTALGFMNVRLSRQLSHQAESTRPAVAFSRTAQCPAAAESRQTVLGFSGETVTEFWHTYHDLPVGIFVQSVESGSPADENGIVPGDILLSVNDTPVASMEALEALLSSLSPGNPVEILLQRENVRLTVNLTLED